MDCGVFAAANALLLVSGQDPQSTVFNQPALHQHLFYCIESDSATLFPTFSHPTNDAGSSLLDKYFRAHIETRIQNCTV